MMVLFSIPIPVMEMPTSRPGLLNLPIRLSQATGQKRPVCYGTTAASVAFGGLFSHAIQLMGTRQGLHRGCGC